MPELPEVTVITQQLNRKLKGLTLESIEYDWPKKFYWNGYSIDDLKGAKVVGVRRMGKVVLIEVSQVSKVLTILIHLKLTGQLIYQDVKSRVAGGHPIPPLNLPVPNKTTRVTFSFAGGGNLYFNDIRKFGWVKIVTSDTEQVTRAIGIELGPDPLVMSYEQFRDGL